MQSAPYYRDQDGLVAAVKADTISLIAFEIGLFAWMALPRFVLFPQKSAASWTHGLMMQIGMIIGFLTSCPANWRLIRKGVKETMQEARGGTHGRPRSGKPAGSSSCRQIAISPRALVRPEPPFPSGRLSFEVHQGHSPLCRLAAARRRDRDRMSGTIEEP